MFFKFLLLFTLLSVAEKVSGKCNPGQNPNICSAAFCVGVDSCPPGEKLIEYDPKNCVCCNYCEKNYNHNK